MKDLYQTSVYCDVCGIRIPVPEQEEWPDSDYVFVDCDNCSVTHKISALRMERPAYWTIVCDRAGCDEEREITWEGMESKEKPFHPRCEACGCTASLEKYP